MPEGDQSRVVRLGLHNFANSGDPPENARLLTSELVPEPLWYLLSIRHRDYLRTDYWKIRRQQFIDEFEAVHGDLRCESCNVSEIDRVEVEVRWWSNYNGDPCSSSVKHKYECTAVVEKIRRPRWEVHHLTYERKGAELDSDLELRCEMCHNLATSPRSETAKFWEGYHFTPPADMEPDVREVWDRYHGGGA